MSDPLIKMITIPEARERCKKAGTTLDSVAAAFAARTGSTVYDSFGIPKWVEVELLEEQLAQEKS